MSHVVVRDSGPAERCATCHGDLDGVPWTCPACKTTTHSDCAGGTCPTLGCQPAVDSPVLAEWAAVRCQCIPGGGGGAEAHHASCPVARFYLPLLNGPADIKATAENRVTLPLVVGPGVEVNHSFSVAVGRFTVTVGLQRGAWRIATGMAMLVLGGAMAAMASRIHAEAHHVYDWYVLSTVLMLAFGVLRCGGQRGTS